jgi:pSer/pThr/pTyr-binding forkhead associated (FHA) protein
VGGKRIGDGPGSEGGAPDSPLAAHSATPQELRRRQEMVRLGSPFLLLREPEGEQVFVRLAGRTRLTIGRRPESDLSLPWDARVSRLHAELEMVGNDWVISDDGLSTNGTWVEGARLTGRHRLHDGDQVRVGDTVLAFCAPLEMETATAVADDSASAARISPAQRRVLVALCRPYLAAGSLTTPTNAQLAGELHLAIDSIKTHLRALFEAFDLGDVATGQKRSSLVERAVKTGLVQPRDAVEDAAPAGSVGEPGQAP